MKFTVDEISTLVKGFKYLYDKYEIDTGENLSIWEDSEIMEYESHDEESQIYAPDEFDVIKYKTQDLLRYFPLIEGIKSDCVSAYSGHIRQVILSISEWDIEKSQLFKYHYVDNLLKISFIENPLLIGLVAVENGLYDDNYGVTPISFYTAAEIEYIGAERISPENELELLKQILYTISVEKGISIEVGRFFSFDDIIDYEYDGDGVEENVILTPCDLLSYNKSMDYYIKALGIKDSTIKFLHFYKVIEYFSPIASKKVAYEQLNLRLDTLKVKNRDHKYLESIFEISRNYDNSLRDKELTATVLIECIDVAELFDLLPSTLQHKISKKLKIQDIDRITSFPKPERDAIAREVGIILYSTRNSIVHAKSNYTSTGNECADGDLYELNIFMDRLCQCLILWNNRQPSEYKTK